jgi:dihydroorotase
MSAAGFDMVVRGGQCVTPGGVVDADIGIRGGRIFALGNLGSARTNATLDARGLCVLPGVIDAQVHFREPGLTHKEDLITGSRAAVLGGVTAVLDMPNTKPATTTAALLADKVALVRGRALCHVGFFVGATPHNINELGDLEDQPGCAGVKVFMGSSTGDLLVSDDESLAQVLANGRRRVAIHAEDEARLRERRDLTGGGVAAHPEWRDVETAFRATWRLVALANRFGRRVHLLHVSTAEELKTLTECRGIATVEVTPQHLTLAAPECYQQLGTRAQMNPPIRDARHREALWAALRDGLIDVVATDHAPHTLEEKAVPYPESPSGMPGVQTLVPLMLDHVAAGRLSLLRMVDLLCAGPARVYGIANKGRIALGYDADLTIVDLKASQTIRNQDMASRCGWTPFDGTQVTGWPVATMIRGHIAMRDGELLGSPHGRPLRFHESLAHHPASE